MALSKQRKTPADYTSPRRRILMTFFYPLCHAAGRLAGINGEKIDDYFIEKNNMLIMESHRKYKREQILLLFPHCLQDWECPHRITADVHNCHSCGKCSIPQLIDIADRYQVPMRVVGGGSAARRAILEQKPLFVLAVACERDMISGIKDSLPLPVIGILNERPNGPCKNTRVDISRVEQALAALLE